MCIEGNKLVLIIWTSSDLSNSRDIVNAVCIPTSHIKIKVF